MHRGNFNVALYHAKIKIREQISKGVSDLIFTFEATGVHPSLIAACDRRRLQLEVATALRKQGYQVAVNGLSAPALTIDWSIDKIPEAYYSSLKTKWYKSLRRNRNNADAEKTKDSKIMRPKTPSRFRPRQSAAVGPKTPTPNTPNGFFTSSEVESAATLVSNTPKGSYMKQYPSLVGRRVSSPEKPIQHVVNHNMSKIRSKSFSGRTLLDAPGNSVLCQQSSFNSNNNDSVDRRTPRTPKGRSTFRSETCPQYGVDIEQYDKSISPRYIGRMLSETQQTPNATRDYMRSQSNNEQYMR